jgi:hypothetical protein
MKSGDRLTNSNSSDRYMEYNFERIDVENLLNIFNIKGVCDN